MVLRACPETTPPQDSRIFDPVCWWYTTDMENLVLYRKYRPAKFDDVAGQDHVVSVLRNSIAKKKIGHSYLFCGSRGTGKTSVARIFAREIGCEDVDLYEIDAASNRGIDDVRTLRDAVRTSPFKSPYKVYIIDEVHMLTKEAFNALLKTLEEPPAHVVFILATTEYGKLPETIISRCELHTFKKPAQALLSKVLADTAKKEGYALSKAAADLIALFGDGSFRDAYGVLQKVFNGVPRKKIEIEDVEKITHAPPRALVRDVAHALAHGDLPKGLIAVTKAAESNVDFFLFLKMILGHLRGALLLRYAPDMRQVLSEEHAEEDFAQMGDIARNGSRINSAVLLEILRAAEMTERAYIPQLPIEIALVKMIGETGAQK